MRERCELIVFSSFRLHYKEYLVDKINKNKLDPITIYNTNQIKVMLSREELKVPVQNEDENREQDQTDEQFREILIQVCNTLHSLSTSEV